MQKKLASIPPLVFKVEHPIALDCLTRMRDIHTGDCDEFVRLANQASVPLACAITDRRFETESVNVETPIQWMQDGTRLVDCKPLLVPIMRAGLGMLDAFKLLLPRAQVAFIDMSRDEASLKPTLHRTTFPPDLLGRHVILMDIMFATGGSAIRAVELCKTLNAKSITFASILAAPEGLNAFYKAYPDVPVFVVKVDSHLNKQGYIVPGLGDAGDRMYGTKK